MHEDPHPPVLGVQGEVAAEHSVHGDRFGGIPEDAHEVVAAGLSLIPPGSGVDDQDAVDGLVVVPGVGNAVGPLVVEARVVDGVVGEVERLLGQALRVPGIGQGRDPPHPGGVGVAGLGGGEPAPHLAGELEAAVGGGGEEIGHRTAGEGAAAEQEIAVVVGGVVLAVRGEVREVHEERHHPELGHPALLANGGLSGEMRRGEVHPALRPQPGLGRGEMPPRRRRGGGSPGSGHERVQRKRHQEERKRPDYGGSVAPRAPISGRVHAAVTSHRQRGDGGPRVPAPGKSLGAATPPVKL